MVLVGEVSIIKKYFPTLIFFSFSFVTTSRRARGAHIWREGNKLRKKWVKKKKEMFVLSPLNTLKMRFFLYWNRELLPGFSVEQFPRSGCTQNSFHFSFLFFLPSYVSYLLEQQQVSDRKQFFFFLRNIIRVARLVRFGLRGPFRPQSSRCLHCRKSFTRPCPLFFLDGRLDLGRLFFLFFLGSPPHFFFDLEKKYQSLNCGIFTIK